MWLTTLGLYTTNAIMCWVLSAYTLPNFCIECGESVGMWASKTLSVGHVLLVTRWLTVSCAYQSLQPVMASHGAVEQLNSPNGQSGLICTALSQPPSYKETSSFRRTYWSSKYRGIELRHWVYFYCYVHRVEWWSVHQPMTKSIHITLWLNLPGHRADLKMLGAHIYEHSHPCYYVYLITDKLSTTTLYLELHYLRNATILFSLQPGIVVSMVRKCYYRVHMKTLVLVLQCIYVR